MKTTNSGVTTPFWMSHRHANVPVSLSAPVKVGKHGRMVHHILPLRCAAGLLQTHCACHATTCIPDAHAPAGSRRGPRGPGAAPMRRTMRQPSAARSASSRPASARARRGTAHAPHPPAGARSMQARAGRPARGVGSGGRRSAGSLPRSRHALICETTQKTLFLAATRPFCQDLSRRHALVAASQRLVECVRGVLCMLSAVEGILRWRSTGCNGTSACTLQVSAVSCC